MIIERLSEMYEGSYTPVMIDGVSYHKQVFKSSKGLYIRVGKGLIYEQDLPIGEEVTRC